jgi:hypothetical protein
MNNRTSCFVLLSLSLLVLSPPTVVRAQWELDQRLTWNDSVSYTCGARPCLAVSPSGVMHLVWCDNRDGNYEIYYKRSTDQGRSWDSVDTRLTFYSGESVTPTVSVSGAVVHVAWWDGRTGDYEIYYKQSSNGGDTWSSDIRLTYASGFSRFVSQATMGSMVNLVWEDSRTGNFEIFYKRSSDGGSSWSPDTQLTYNTRSSNSPAIAVQGDTVHIVWFDDRDKIGFPEIYYKCSTDAGISWSSDIRLTYDSSASLVPTISTSGPFVHVAWSDERDGHFEVYYKRSSDGGQTWSPDTRLSDLPYASSSSPIYASGNLVHVAWEDERDGNQEIYYKRSPDSGLTWSFDTQLTQDTSSSHHPYLTVSNAVVHVVWNEERDGNPEVYYKRNPTGNGAENFQGKTEAQTPRLGPLPNPFVSFTTLPRHSTERFALYDISGRRVGSYKGDRIGEGLRAGVYFVRAENGDRKPLRVVKVR